MPNKRKSFWRFLLTKVFWKNLGIAFAISLVIFVLVKITLHIYTGHGKEITVPNLTGMDLAEVDQLCYQKDLLWVIQDSIYQPDLPGGEIIDQYPPAGFRVKKKRKIFLTVNSWYPEMVMMPKASDTHFRQAKRILEMNGLFVDSLEYEPYFARTYVMKQKFRGTIIDPGTPIEKGSGITLVLGQGLSNETDYVPKLVHLTKDTATNLALDLHFNIGAVVYDQSILTGEDSIMSRVYKQFPDFHDRKAQLGSPIDIWLTIDSLKLLQADSSLFPVDSLSGFATDTLY